MDESDKPKRTRGRPKKAAEDKATQLTVYLLPEDRERLERVQRAGEGITEVFRRLLIAADKR